MTTRKPLPALVFLTALTVLTLLVWWRVIHRTTAPEAGGPSSPAGCTHAGANATVLPAPATITVHVRNATDRAGLAGQVRDALNKAGFKVADIGNATKPVASIGEIRYGAKSKDAATSLSFYVPGATLVDAQRPGADVEIDLGARFGRVASGAEVTTAMQNGKATFQRPTATATAC